MNHETLVVIAIAVFIVAYGELRDYRAREFARRPIKSIARLQWEWDVQQAGPFRGGYPAPWWGPLDGDGKPPPKPS